MNKNILTTAVSATMLVGLAASATAQAHSHALLPYVVKDANRTTVVTLIGSAYGDSGAAGQVHLQYWTKSTTAANTAACEPNSVTIPMTVDDMLTFDTGGLLGYPLFGDTTNPAALGVAISYPGPRHGYLVAEFPAGGAEGAYWLELDLANGGAHGDAGLRNVWGSEGFQGDFVIGDSGNSLWDYQSIFGPGPGYVTPLHGLMPGPIPAGAEAWSAEGARGPRAVNFWPTSVASTVFTVTPLGTTMVTKENNQVVMQVLKRGGGGWDSFVQGAYDRNENGIDGTVPLTVRCVGRLTPAQLMPGVVTNAAWAAQGGWGFLANLGDGDTNLNELYYFGSDGPESTGNVLQDFPAMVYQVDSSSAGGKFMSNATRIESKDSVMSVWTPSLLPPPVP